MSKRFQAFAFGIGLAVVGWVGWGFIGSSWLALAMTAVIAAVYLFGGFELRQFRTATAALDAALRELVEPPAALADWLERMPATLRNVVRLRVEGERVGLPGPALTPYLVGLLVMLGMLGTFLGMVVTFKGAVFALEGSTDLNTIRAALAAPVKGLGLSFGTSIAGVAASAMLGLMATLARRERLEVARRLDLQVASVLQRFSLTHQRQQTYRALQAQADALPRVVDQLQVLIERIEQRSDALDRQLLERQSRFQREVVQAYGDLAGSVGASLRESAGASAQAAGEQLRPIVEGAMAQVAQLAQQMHERVAHEAQEAHARMTEQAGQVHETVTRQAQQVSEAASQQSQQLQERIAQQAEQLHQRVAEVAQQQVSALSAQFEALAQGTARTLAQSADEIAQRAGAQAEATSRALAQAAAEIAESAGGQAQRTLAGVAQLVEQSEQLVRARTQAEERFNAQHGERMDALAALWRSELAALREQEDQRGAAAVGRLGELQQAVAQHLATLGAALEAPITRLLQTASEVPQAAAGVIAQLREQMQGVAERDNLALTERNALLDRFASLLGALQQASGEQRAAIDALVASASSVLQDAGAQFAAALQAQGAQVDGVAAQVTASAVELASVAEAFGAGVQQFQAGNDKLTASLQAIEASLTRSTARSDEQLAYYVAQAREVIDLSVASQQGLMESLRELRARPAKAEVLADEAAA